MTNQIHVAEQKVCSTDVTTQSCVKVLRDQTAHVSAQYSVGSKRVGTVVLLLARQIFGIAGGSTIINLFLELIEADCDGLLNQRFC